MGHSVFEGFVKASAMILVSEIGDKTFFVAALMAMRHPRGVVLAGALGALGLMTVLSALFGWAAPNLISRRLTQNAATVLFFFFGLRSLWQAFTTEDSMSSELAEVEAELDGDGKKPSEKTQGVKDNPKRGNLALQYLSPVLIETFSLTFLGEWGDRSQIATIGLAAQESVTGVALGGILGHAICTTAAVLGGKHLATQISEKAVSLCGGVLFLIFGVHSLLSGVEES
ncbi:Ca2+/H+ antiporter, TMEM165/GDT1 family [Marchantia polymorpha subsp. ruderalis]|uniref:GDT1 family protein n=2 Tax=Marchantia polymorpha TaxID=3197 RepID=A0AAF6BH41_MARPO|nr:hypothetical protein MARPO_0093s0014 [Marchantia polymorpha]BBN11325.1 hypothetical protein Mp_5g10930 [Marchantia polymorpha subsp. ruderalis]|eukprot:PTQ32931.1 hypothetical protein MARPO_0093s0014 [Marchantia polymorpha]